MLPILAHEWGEADGRVHCGPPGRREAGGLRSQDPQRAGHHGRQAMICRDHYNFTSEVKYALKKSFHNKYYEDTTDQ